MTPWSLMRILSVAIASVCSLLLAALYCAAVMYTGRFAVYPAFWLVAFVAAIAAIGAIGAHVRDSLSVKQDRVLRRLDEIERRLDDYGDRREIAGHVSAVNGTRPHRLASVPD